MAAQKGKKESITLVKEQFYALKIDFERHLGASAHQYLRIQKLFCDLFSAGEETFYC